MLTCSLSSSEELEQKGKELDLQAWAPRAGPRVGVGKGESLWTPALFFLDQDPVPTCQRQGHSDSFPFQSGKPPLCPHPHPGLRGLEEKAWSPRGQAPVHIPSRRCQQLVPGGRDHGTSVDTCPWVRKESTVVSGPAAPPPARRGPSPAWRLPHVGLCGLMGSDTPGTRDRDPSPWNLGSRMRCPGGEVE